MWSLGSWVTAPGLPKPIYPVCSGAWVEAHWRPRSERPGAGVLVSCPTLLPFEPTAWSWPPGPCEQKFCSRFMGGVLLAVLK